jgi:predicted amidophosphoribosyltransferase
MLTAKTIQPISLRSQFIMFRDCWHLVKYIPRSEDAISQSIIRYKQQDPLITEKWNNLVVKHIIQLNINAGCVIRALGSREMVCTGKRPLDELCFKLAKYYSIEYNPYLLMKKDFTRPLHGLPKKLRVEQLNNKYIFNLSPALMPPSTILILDDIVTTGTTMLAIRDAIKLEIPKCEIFFFALARTMAKW